MLKKRLIPILLLREGMLVKSIQFKQYRPVGNPKVAIDYFNTWEVDEIIFLDISPGKEYQQGRKDINLQNFQKLSEYTQYISEKCFVPLTVGGGINSIDHIRTLLQSGADKISINTITHTDPSFISKAAKIFGRQCVVVSMDVKKNAHSYEVFTNGGKEPTGKDPLTWAKEAVERGAGEILIQSIDKDGTLAGYDLELIQHVSDNISAPVIACSGVGKWEDLAAGITVGHASAVAAANIFHYTEHSTRHAKQFLRSQGIEVR